MFKVQKKWKTSLLIFEGQRIKMCIILFLQKNNKIKIDDCIKVSKDMNDRTGKTEYGVSVEYSSRGTFINDVPVFWPFLTYLPTDYGHPMKA